MAKTAEIVSMELIKPSDQLLKPPHSKLLKLSLIDQFAPPGYIPLVFFYHNSEPLFDSSEKTQNLKQAMSAALAKFYPLAGRLNPGALSVDCDDSGALFIEASFHATFSEALKNGANLPEINQFLPFHPFENDGEKLFGTYSRNEILFAAKVSWFDCGSCAIGVCLLHAVGDVMCLVSFVNSWAGGTSVFTVPELDFESTERLFPALKLPADSDSTVDQPAAATVVKNVSRRLLFDKEKIAELKLLAGSTNPTRVEVVTAFIWKHLIELERAKKKNVAAETMFIARHPVNIRPRISSFVSTGKLGFGNVAVVTSASLMLPGKDEDLVLLTRAALRKVDEDFVINNVQGDPVSYVKSMTATGVDENVMVHECYFTCWNRFQMYQVNFGWGNPVLVTPAGTPACTGVVVLMGTPSGDGIEAWIGIGEDDLPLLLHEFTTLATTRIFPES